MNKGQSLYLHDRTAVRSGAGTPQVPCQEWCRNWPTGSAFPRAQRFPGLSVSQGSAFPRAQKLSACTRVPHREGNSMGGLPLFNAWIENRQGGRERRSFCPNQKSSPGLRVQIPVHYPLGYRFTLWIKFTSAESRRASDSWRKDGCEREGAPEIRYFMSLVEPQWPGSTATEQNIMSTETNLAGCRHENTSTNGVLGITILQSVLTDSGTFRITQYFTRETPLGPACHPLGPACHPLGPACHLVGPACHPLGLTYHPLGPACLPLVLGFAAFSAAYPFWYKVTITFDIHWTMAALLYVVLGIK